MSTKSRATVEDLYRVEGKAELVNGELLPMSPTGWDHGYAARQILMALCTYEERTGTGWAVGDNVGFLVNLPRRQSFSPDVAYTFSSDPGRKFFQGAPVFAVEVRSENDYGPTAEKEVAAKRADYFAAGTQVVWDVDLQSPDVVHVYRATDPARPAIYRRGELAEAEPALPGWTIPVDKLFKSRLGTA